MIKNLCISYFNCTIQELKPDGLASLEDYRLDFNCTIQELKHFFVGR